MKRIKLFLATLAFLLGVGGGLVPMVASAATAKEDVCSTLSAGTDCTQDSSGSVSLNNVLKAVINTMSVLVGVVAVIMIMVSGYKYVTAAGDSNKVTSAKNTLIYAIVGLVVVALAEGIVKLVLTKLK